jgi:hypothetical protein
MTALTPIKVVYAISSLLPVFAAALETKKAKVANYEGWATDWPQGNTKSEQLVVDWLQAQQRDGLTQIETQFPIADKNPMGDAYHTLAMQIQTNMAKGIA